MKKVETKIAELAEHGIYTDEGYFVRWYELHNGSHDPANDPKVGDVVFAYVVTKNTIVGEKDEAEALVTPGHEIAEFEADMIVEAVVEAAKHAA